MKVSIIYDYDGIRKSKHIDSIKKYKNNIKHCIEKCLNEENIQTNNVELYIKYTANEEIQKINKEFRQIDKPTDVLSFPMYERNDLTKEIEKYNVQDIPITLGDIVISIEKVEEQAKEYEHSFERELIYLVTHSMFHLLGYDHMEAKDKKIMRAKEEKIMNILNITR